MSSSSSYHEGHTQGQAAAKVADAGKREREGDCRCYQTEAAGVMR